MGIPKEVDFSVIVYEGFNSDDVAKKFEVLGLKVRSFKELGALFGTAPVALIEEVFKTKFEDLGSDWTLSNNPITPDAVAKEVEAVCIERPIEVTC